MGGKRLCVCVIVCVLMGCLETLSIGYYSTISRPPIGGWGRLIFFRLDKDNSKRSWLFFSPTGWYYGPRCYCAFVVYTCNFAKLWWQIHILYKTFISVCELLWACWIPMCCCVNTLSLGQWLSGHFWGNFAGFFFIVYYVHISKGGGSSYILWLFFFFPLFPLKPVLVMIAGWL